MPLIRPFKAVIYNKDKVKDIAKVVAPPYDVITPRMQDSLYRRHDNNVVRLILAKIKKTDNGKNNRYTRAKDYFESWLNKNILIKDEVSAIYIYSQIYRFEGRLIERTGFMGLMKLDLENKKEVDVLPHENTLNAPKKDRLNLMRSVNANLSPVFMLYEDDGKKIIGALLKKVCENEKPLIDVSIDGVRHIVRTLTEKNDIEAIQNFMAGKDIFIADGHHRYETALNYAREIENSPASRELKNNSKYMMAYFCALDEEILTILPTHRLVRDIGDLSGEDILERLSKFFVVEKIEPSKGLVLKLGELKDRHAFGMYLGKGAFYVIRLKRQNLARPFMGKASAAWKGLDVAILHLFIIQNVLALRDEDDNIEFVKDAQEALKFVDEGKFKAAFFLNPTKISQVKEVARLGEKMPRKATYFYPKPLSGLVINKF